MPTTLAPRAAALALADASIVTLAPRYGKP